MSASGALDPTELATWLGRAILQAESAWRGQGVAIAPADFARYLAERAARVSGGDERERLHVDELYLVCACLQNHAVAVHVFQRDYFVQARRVLGRMAIADFVAEEVLGALREQLFLGEQGKPRLFENYSGRGDLGSWLRAIAVRHALRMTRKERRAVGGDAIEIPMADPELVYLRTVHGAHLRDALTRAFGELTVEQRNLLRQHYIDGLSIDVLGGLYAIHRATAARRLEAARRELVRRVREILGAELRLATRSIDSLVQIVGSDLGISLTRLFATPQPTG